LLSDGVQQRDVAKLKGCQQRMEILLATQPTKIVVRLNETARGLLPELKKLQQLKDAARVSDLEARLDVLVSRHDRWQGLDSLLRETNPVDYPSDVWWPDVKNLATGLLEGVQELWAAAFRRALGELDAAILAGDSVRIRREFGSLRRQTELRFQRADTELKRLCDELRRLDGPYGFLRMAS
jgi:hypothetical protein